MYPGCQGLNFNWAPFYVGIFDHRIKGKRGKFRYISGHEESTMEFLDQATTCNMSLVNKRTFFNLLKKNKRQIT
jgi:hypothetical protein